MSRQNRAIVILYTGDELKDRTASKLMQVLVEENSVIPELTTIVALDENDMAKNIAAKVMLQKEESTEAKALVHAVTYIGKQFEKELKSGPIAFAMAFGSHAMYASHVNRNDPATVALHNAIRIIHTTSLEIPNPLRVKYNFTKECEDIVHETYNRIF